jgi:hypothetical protein
MDEKREVESKGDIIKEMGEIQLKIPAQPILLCLFEYTNSQEQVDQSHYLVQMFQKTFFDFLFLSTSLNLFAYKLTSRGRARRREEKRVRMCTF